MFQKQENVAKKSSGVKTSTEKLLSNRFARQVQLLFCMSIVLQVCLMLFISHACILSHGVII